MFTVLAIDQWRRKLPAHGVSVLSEPRHVLLGQLRVITCIFNSAYRGALKEINVSNQ